MDTFQKADGAEIVKLMEIALQNVTPKLYKVSYSFGTLLTHSSRNFMHFWNKGRKMVKAHSSNNQDQFFDRRRQKDEWHRPVSRLAFPEFPLSSFSSSCTINGRIILLQFMYQTESKPQKNWRLGLEAVFKVCVAFKSYVLPRLFAQPTFPSHRRYSMLIQHSM